MAWLVNAVDITASASTDGVTAATRGSGSGTTSSTREPDQQQHRDDQREQHLLAVAQRQPQLGGRPARRASGRRRRAGSRGERAGGNGRIREAASRPQLPAGQLEEHVLEAAARDLHVVGEHALRRAPAR